MNHALIPVIGTLLEKLFKHFWPDKPAVANLGDAMKNRLREPSTWAGTGQGVALLMILFGPEKGEAAAAVVASLLALYEIVRAERARKPSGPPA